ncbi:hypothetical protein ACX9NE_11285 [Mycobacterium sp. ML4]
MRYRAATLPGMRGKRAFDAVGGYPPLTPPEDGAGPMSPTSHVCIRIPRHDIV